MTNSRQNQANDHPEHIVCFVAIPFNDNENFKYKTVLLPALRKVLELHPYYWQVVRADEKYFEDMIQGNVGAWMRRVQAYIADISDENPNVMMELSYMLWAKQPGQPLLVLKRTDSRRYLADLAEFMYISYPHIYASNRDDIGKSDKDLRYDIDRIADILRDQFNKYASIQRLNEVKLGHYLPPLLLTEQYALNNEVAEKLSKTFVTIEAVVEADQDTFRRQAAATGLSPLLANPLKEMITKLALFNE